MDTTVAAIIIAAVTLLFNISIHLFGGGTRLSAKLSAMTTTLETVQLKIEKLSEVLVNMADMRGEINVLANRVTHTEEDIREIRHGEGFVRGARGIDKEYP